MRDIWTILGEFIGALMLIVIFYGLLWLPYILTGEYTEF